MKTPALTAAWLVVAKPAPRSMRAVVAFAAASERPKSVESPAGVAYVPSMSSLPAVRVKAPVKTSSRLLPVELFRSSVPAMLAVPTFNAPSVWEREPAVLALSTTNSWSKYGAEA